jgi:hypothetical protein
MKRAFHRLIVELAQRKVRRSRATIRQHDPAGSQKPPSKVSSPNPATHSSLSSLQSISTTVDG